MEKKSNKGLYVVIGVLAALVVVLAIVVLSLVFRGEKETTVVSTQMAAIGSEPAEDDVFGEGNTGAKSEASDNTDYFANEVTDEDTDVKNGNFLKVVIDGFKVLVPAEYGCFYEESIGVVIYMDDVFQMKLAVSEKSMDAIKETPSIITEKTTAAGGEILQDVKFAEVEGKEYAYFVMDLYGDKCFMVYSQAADSGKTVGGQIVIENDKLTDDDWLHVFAPIAASAQVTDEANSTAEDIMQEISDANTGERKSESTLTFEGETVTFKVPDAFYGQGQDNWEYYASESFMTTDYITTHCYLRSTKTEDYTDAENYIATMAEFDMEEDWENKIKTMEMNGLTYYYFIHSYEYDGSKIQKFYAACNVGKSGIYSVETYASDVDTEITVEMHEEFMTLK